MGENTSGSETNATNVPDVLYKHPESDLTISFPKIQPQQQGKATQMKSFISHYSTVRRHLDMKLFWDAT